MFVYKYIHAVTVMPTIWKRSSSETKQNRAARVAPRSIELMNSKFKLDVSKSYLTVLGQLLIGDVCRVSFAFCVCLHCFLLSIFDFLEIGLRGKINGKFLWYLNMVFWIEITFEIYLLKTYLTWKKNTAYFQNIMKTVCVKILHYIRHQQSTLVPLLST